MKVLLQGWNTSSEFLLQSFVLLDDENLKTFGDTIEPSKRGFFNPIVEPIVPCKFF